VTWICIHSLLDATIHDRVCGATIEFAQKEITGKQLIHSMLSPIRATSQELQMCGFSTARFLLARIGESVE
jgi:hypothetical protein